MADSESTTSTSQSLPVRPTATSHLSTASAFSTVLTPGTRAEAEFAFSTNASAQTSSAAPSASPPVDSESPVVGTGALRSRRPEAPPRSGSNNFVLALAASPVSPEGTDGLTFSPVTSELARKSGGEGVASERPDVGVKSPLDRQPSWSNQDMKRMQQQRVMDGVEGLNRPGYDSVQEKK